MLSGFTLVRNAVRLDYPIVPAIRSILGICDEVVVNVGKSEDETRDLVAALADPRVRIIDTVWDFSRGSGVLAVETERALRACRGAWGLYIQADEVLHETGAAILAERVRAWDGDVRVEGLLVDYRHFYGDFATVATNRHWYRREVRCVRLGGEIHSYQDAQGFRVGAAERPVRARGTGAQMFHYGWARPPQSLTHKLHAAQQIFTEAAPPAPPAPPRPVAPEGLAWTPLLRPFHDTHPRVAQAWIAARGGGGRDGRAVGRRRFRLEHLRLYASDWIERLSGARVFEYRNYVEV
jgi:hypothetical protein